MSTRTGPEPFTTFAAPALPIDIANCDTDQIIPARFLRRADDDPEYHRFLLHDLRFDAVGGETDFIYNREPYRGARILVADINWGCGSSRENAVTALLANGFRCVIAPSIADIHYANCVRNGVLPVRLDAAACATLRAQLHANPGAEIAVDLESQSLSGPDQTRYDFEIDGFDKHRLRHGLDDIAMTLEHADEIDGFRADYGARRPWLG